MPLFCTEAILISFGYTKNSVAIAEHKVSDRFMSDFKPSMWFHSINA